MVGTTITNERITITADTVREARASTPQRGAQLVLKNTDGSEQTLPPNVQEMLMRALASVAARGAVSIGEIPEVLTSNEAADVLGVSRPTVMKWAREGELGSFKRGTHTRFHRDEVLRLRDRRRARQRAAFEELRRLEADNLEFFADS